MPFVVEIASSVKNLQVRSLVRTVLDSPYFVAATNRRDSYVREVDSRDFLRRAKPARVWRCCPNRS